MELITGKILKLNGWPDGKIIGFAKLAAETLASQDMERDTILEKLNAVRDDPGRFFADPVLSDVAREWVKLTQKDEPQADTLRDTPMQFPVWGEDCIDPEAVRQMENAMRLPVTVGGALMPDAHVGYGLPIGGVLATDNSVIPYAVGVDIACRMRLSLYDVSPHLLGQKKGIFEQSLWNETAFGVGAKWTGAKKASHDVLDDEAWYATGLLRTLKDTAMNQLGTSGTGNHFVEWGAFELHEPMFGLEPGHYLALLSHSGSRGVGAKIADRYSRLAMDQHPSLDKSVKHLAWLGLDTEAGQEYWLSMELAGRFASANHAIIHRRVAAAAGLKEAAAVENHHNFAWKESLPDGTTAIIHRKGATPASTGTLGIIPGSMADAGFLIRGRGEAASLNSASHGAGRLMSRKTALASISKGARNEYLKANGVTLLGGGMDESPQAYKRIEEVIRAQDDLIEILGKFLPRLVRMADEPGDN